MSRSDPGETTGHGTYPPPPPRCTCRHLDLIHTIGDDGVRGSCGAGSITGPCPCTRYTPEATNAA